MRTTAAAPALLGAVLLFAPPAPGAEPRGTDPGGVAECVALVERRPDDLDSYRCLWVASRRSGASDAAKSALEKLLRERPDDPRVLLFLGSVEGDRGEAEAPQLLERAVRGFEAAGHAAGEVYAEIAYALWLRGQQRPVDARPHLDRAMAAAERCGDRQLLARAQAALAWCMVDRDDYAQARSLFLAAEAVAFPDGPFDLKSTILDGLGYVDWATDRLRSALVHYRREAELHAAAGNLREEAGCRYNIALMVNALAVTPEDVAFADTLTVEALQVATRVDSPSLEARLRLLLAQPFDGDPVRREEAERALALARVARKPELELEAMRGLGQHDFAAGRRAAGLAEVEQAAAAAREMGDRIGTVSALLDLAELLWEDGESQRAAAVSYAALDEIESLRDLQSSDEDRARVASRWSEGYARLVGRLLGGEPTRDALEQALRVSERLRLQLLLELLEQTGAGPVAPQEARLPPDLSLRSLQAALEPDEALVSYQVANRFNAIGRWQGGSWAVVVTSDQVRAIPLADQRDLDAAVNLYQGLVERRDGSELKAATKLYELVVGPVLRTLPARVRNLVLIPDAVLYTAPFAALRRTPDAPPVGSDLVLSSVPSVALWWYWRQHRVAARAGGALALADPELGPAPTCGSLHLEHLTSALGPLPFARREAHRVCRRLGGGSRLLEGREASRSALLTADLRTVGVLHLAAHSLVDAEDPSRSAVLLAPSAAEGDGCVGAAQVSGLHLEDALVVLASCRSASGVVLQGEGVLGLTRAFFHAGARAVVGTLWPVEDRETARLMDAFYRHLAAGATVAQALAAAQREALAAGEPTAAWASLVVVGDGTLRVAAEPAATGTWFLVGAGVLAVATAVIGGLWRRARRRTSPG